MKIEDIKIGERYLSLIDLSDNTFLLLSAEVFHIDGKQIRLKDLNFIRNTCPNIIISEDNKQWRYNSSFVPSMGFNKIMSTPIDTIYNLEEIDTLKLIVEVL